MTTNTPYRPSLPVNREFRRLLAFSDDRYDRQGRLILESPREARELAVRISKIRPSGKATAGDLWGAAHIFTAWRIVLDEFHSDGHSLETAGDAALEKNLGTTGRSTLLAEVAGAFPDEDVWVGRRTPQESLDIVGEDFSGRETVLRELVLARIAGEDPAFSPFQAIFDASPIWKHADGDKAWSSIEEAGAALPPKDPEEKPPIAFLRKPIAVAPNSVRDQLTYILSHWKNLLGSWAEGLLGVLDLIAEENRPRFGGPGPGERPGISDLDDGIARFSKDDDWMPRVVMIAKNVLVWLDQLSRSRGTEIRTLEAIPDDELDLLASRGFNALWLIGLWERSEASREIKRRMGNPEASASAYSLFDYEIASELGGWGGLDNLRRRAEARGLRLASDMVPNHVGIDSSWVYDRPELLMSTADCPFPSYHFEGPNLSSRDDVEIHIEDHYWDHSDAAVVMKRTHRESGAVSYIYHGNDGTTMPWNDTAQIDFLNPAAREAVTEKILQVARNFPIIRFDAAMVLAKKHIRRLWYPAPGSGGAIPSRSSYAMDDASFEQSIPDEFWREVVDRVAVECPGTLLLAEAFWMMEGYFVRSLGMHRVYNSAFMNMMKNEANAEYRDIIKETLAFDPGILGRFVNFMNNPDEETAVAQFGKDDKYFSVCTLQATLPGLPMIGHGQVEGFSEKYGMEYTRAYYDESPDSWLVDRHEREIFPLFRNRRIFAGSRNFRLYDLVDDNGGVAESVYAFTNEADGDRSLVVVNNAFPRAAGRIHHAAPVPSEKGLRVDGIADALGAERGGPWLLLQEFLSGLWYLRSHDDLRERGLSLVIDGYGRQLFFEFRHVDEAADGAWGKLAAEIEGRGIADPDTALRDLRLRPIWNALDELFPVGFLEEAAEAIANGWTPDFPFGPDRIDAAWERLGVADRSVTGRKSAPGTAEAAGEAIRRRLGGAAGTNRFPGRRIRRKIAKRFSSDLSSDTSKVLAAWSCLAPLVLIREAGADAGGLWAEWGLETWLRRRWSEASEEATSWVAEVEILLARDRVLERAGPELDGGLGDHLAEPSVRSACGINRWDEVLWFGREGFVSTISLLLLASAAAGGGCGKAARRARRRTGKWARRWGRAMEGSDYRVDDLLRKAARSRRTGQFGRR